MSKQQYFNIEQDADDILEMLLNGEVSDIDLSSDEESFPDDVEPYCTSREKEVRVGADKINRGETNDESTANNKSGTLLVSQKMSQSHCHSHNIVTPSVYQTLDELDFERGLWSPAQNGEMSRVKNLLERGVHVDSRDSAGYTALHYAARAGHAAICQQLIAAGALLDAKTRAGGATPLHRAAASGKLHIVQLLLEAGANSAVTDADGRTALHRAAEEGHSDVAELLLMNNIQLNNMKDIKGRLAVECVKDQTMLSVFL
ncbi:ankyrin repeat domain-containing protein 39 [Schistocerca nitens]|uniref:ankyrin repeat domain-containing protein 39 n=1 Tax=Schistocerca nitens TaxID=7011 RepID=UPI0021193924|nr:ankyrin repeat domain-containing protein 39 [Schistocerca nitens]